MNREVIARKLDKGPHGNTFEIMRSEGANSSQACKAFSALLICGVAMMSCIPFSSGPFSAPAKWAVLLG